MSAIEWTGALLGLLGAALLASKMSWSKFGFVAYLVSNVCWIVYAVKHGAYGLLVMQIGFTITSVIGIYRWFRPVAANLPVKTRAR